MTSNLTRNVLVGLLAFLGLGALVGGGALIASPSGQLLGIPRSILAPSPFHSFLVPGILLFCFIGLAPLATIYALLKRPAWRFAERCNVFTDMYWAWTACVCVSFTLILWLQAEMLILRGVSWLHGAYMVLAVVILFVTLLPQVRSAYKK